MPAGETSLLRPGGVLARLGEVTGLVHRPVEVEPVPVVGAADLPALDGAAPFRVVSWNIQYSATRRQKFFYDGGEAVRVPTADRVVGIEEVGRQLAGIAADIALIQEIDRDSDRTDRVDQLPEILALAPYPAWASAPCHRSRFVPAPTGEPLGRVELHVALLARVALSSALRTQLPLLRESRLRRAFNLKRCLLTARLPVRGRERPLHVAVTHLSAFSRGDGTLVDQVGALKRWMEAREAAGDSYVLGGDLNLLPPGDDPQRLGADAKEYADRPNPIELLIPRFRSAVPATRLLDPAVATYLPWGATAPDRVLDYLFVSEDLEVLEAGPASGAPPVSDHLPLVAQLRFRRGPRRAPERRE